MPNNYIQTLTVDGTTYDLKDNISGYITTETDPTVPSWAKASTKPTYTASEVGALPTTGGTMTGNITTSSDYEVRFGTSSTFVGVFDDGEETEVRLFGDFVTIGNSTSETQIKGDILIPSSSNLQLAFTPTQSNDAVTKGYVDSVIPTKTSDLTNDGDGNSPFITTETDPTVPSWAKASSKPTYTYSEVGAAASSHTHGNITNSGDITATAPTIANGDQIIINDHSESKITNGPAFDGSTTSKYLSQKGTWESLPQGTAYTAGTGLSLSGTEFNHSNSITAQTTQAVYPIKIDAQGHISSYGTAVAVTDEKLKVGTVTSGNAYYPVLSTSGTTASTKQIDTAGLTYYPNNGVVQLQVGSSTKIGDIDLINGSYSVSLWPANLTDNRTLTLPDATGTVALTSDITTAVLTATDDGAGNVTLSVTGVTSANLNSASGVSF